LEKRGPWGCCFSQPGFRGGTSRGGKRDTPRLGGGKNWVHQPKPCSESKKKGANCRNREKKVSRVSKHARKFSRSANNRRRGGSIQNEGNFQFQEEGPKMALAEKALGPGTADWLRGAQNWGRGGVRGPPITKKIKTEQEKKASLFLARGK